MSYLGDYHTHTVYSHGKGSIEENVKEAIKKGLKEVAITDHGFRHMLYQVTHKEFQKMQQEVAELRKKYSEITIYLGIESNLNSYDGQADVKPQYLQALDIMVCGYHKFVMPSKLRDGKFFIRNLLFGESKRSATQIKKNTDAYLRLLENYEVDIVSHINYGISTDATEVARACKYYGTYVELNGKRINMSDEELTIMAKEGVEFICNSDAHSPERVGDYSVPQAVIDRVGIPYQQIANWERLPQFRSRKNINQ